MISLYLHYTQGLASECNQIKSCPGLARSHQLEALLLKTQDDLMVEKAVKMV